MARFSVWVVDDKEYDLNDREKFSREAADALERAFPVLRRFLPGVAYTREDMPFGIYEYSYHNPRGCNTILRNWVSCGHEYILATDGWVRPWCAVCDAEFAKRAEHEESGWKKRVRPDVPTMGGKPAEGSDSGKNSNAKMTFVIEKGGK